MTNKVNVLIYIFYISAHCFLQSFFIFCNAKYLTKTKASKSQTNSSKWMLNQKIKQNEKICQTTAPKMRNLLTDSQVMFQAHRLFFGKSINF